ncbi:protochlorophyllide oxidoreductase [Chromatium okenii]|uniref:protochlorophyllide oxidoreductase n=1 Tax=Chromatium okenii TaxID=61644 RepID=UPI0026EB8CDE|nr:protochlorophyllide oxidoreductase [Chromatium okenii]MBV5307970.1 protochlorophyllide oxidoreductase [Chromatium okenii]
MIKNNTPDPYVTLWNRCEAWFLEHLQDCMNGDDFTEYQSFRHNADTHIRARSRLYQGEKLDRVMVHQYSLKAGRSGLVIFGYPRVEYAIPCFLLHIGGMPPARTLLILDLAPIDPALDMTPFQTVAAQQRAVLGLPETQVEWLQPVTSPHLLYCPLKPLEPEQFFATFTATIETWRSAYIEPAQHDTNAAAVQRRSAAIVELKRVLLRNDPAFPVFTRAFGQSMSDVFAEAAFGGNPGVTIAEAVEPLPVPGSWINKKLGVSWNADAQERIHEAPAFLRPIIRRIIEKEAVKEEITVVTLELVLRCEKKYRSGMEL